MFDDLKSFVRGLLSSGATDEEVRNAVENVDEFTATEQEVDQVITEVEGDEATDEDVRNAIEQAEENWEDENEEESFFESIMNEADE